MFLCALYHPLDMGYDFGHARGVLERGQHFDMRKMEFG
jgi:hypothetical protein